MDEKEVMKLVERVEALSGPSREVDAEIFAILFPPKPPEEDEEQPPAGFGAGFHAASYWGHNYTASLDAALTLVPEGDDICLTMGTGPFVGPFARIWTCDPDREEPFDHTANAATPALALTAAALHARIATPIQGNPHAD